MFSLDFSPARRIDSKLHAPELLIQSLRATAYAALVSVASLTPASVSLIDGGYKESEGGSHIIDFSGGSDPRYRHPSEVTPQDNPFWPFLDESPFSPFNQADHMSEGTGFELELYDYDGTATSGSVDEEGVTGY